MQKEKFDGEYVDRCILYVCTYVYMDLGNVAESNEAAAL